MKFGLSITNTAAVALCAAALSITAAPSAARAESSEAATPYCNLNRAKTKVAKTDVDTSAKTFTDIPGSSVIITVAPLWCVVVTFSAEAWASANEVMLVQALIGSQKCEPDETFFVRSNAAKTLAAARSMTFVCENVPAGTHLARIQFSSHNGKVVGVGFRTTLVQYGPLAN